MELDKVFFGVFCVIVKKVKTKFNLEFALNTQRRLPLSCTEMVAITQSLCV